MAEWIEYLDGTPAYTAADIEAATRPEGIELPQDYLSDLITHGGMTTELEEVPVDPEPLVFGLLLPFNEDGISDAVTYTVGDNIAALSEWFATAGAEDRASDFWPFASDTAQGLFCFRRSELPASSVYFVDMDRPPSDSEAISKVANSYGALLDSLV